jgi:hypothetical protein
MRPDLGDRRRLRRMATILESTWADGLYVFEGGPPRHELAGRAVRGLASDDHGNALAIVGGNDLWRRTAGGAWSTLARRTEPLSAIVAVGNDIYVGIDANPPNGVAVKRQCGSLARVHQPVGHVPQIQKHNGWRPVLQSGQRSTLARPVGRYDFPLGAWPLQDQFRPSFTSPDPEYSADCGYGQSGRVRPLAP